MEANSEMFKFQIGAPAIDFDLPGTDGRNYMMRYYLNKDLFVVIFTCNHCPYAQAYEQRLIRLAKQFSAKAAFFAINSNDAAAFPQDSFENMKLRAVEKGFPYPYLRDENQNVAKAYGALVTPHVFVFDKSGKLAFQGGIDNNWENENAVTEHYLLDAVIELLGGKQVSRKTAPVVGCSIKWK